MRLVNDQQSFNSIYFLIRIKITNEFENVTLCIFSNLITFLRVFICYVIYHLLYCFNEIKSFFVNYGQITGLFWFDLASLIDFLHGNVVGS